MLYGKFAPGDSLVCHPAGGELLIPSKKSVSGALSVVQGNQILGKGGQVVQRASCHADRATSPRLFRLMEHATWRTLHGVPGVGDGA